MASEVIEILDDGDSDDVVPQARVRPNGEVIDVEEWAEVAAKRLKIIDDDDVVLVSTTPAPACIDCLCPAVSDEVDEVEEVTHAELSGSAKDKLLARLLAEKQELRARVESLAMEVDATKKSGPVKTAEPGYWRRDGHGQHRENPSLAEFEEVGLDLNGDEALSVLRRFKRDGMEDAEVVRVARVQNRRLWDEFAQRRARLTERLGGDPKAAVTHDILPGTQSEETEPDAHARDHACERYLFHGAPQNVVDTILQTGVDFRLSQPTGAMGACAYFADQSAYSHSYCTMPVHSADAHAIAHAVPHPTQQGVPLKMLLCRVLLGECTNGRPGLRRPPPKGDGTQLFDSVSNSPQNVRNYGSRGCMFGVFDNAQMYPEYIIEYTKSTRFATRFPHRRPVTVARVAPGSSFVGMGSSSPGDQAPPGIAEFVRALSGPVAPRARNRTTRRRGAKR